MKIAQKYSHLNGEEFLIVHQKKLYDEIKDVITSIDANKLKKKISKEKNKTGTSLFSPKELNRAFKKQFQGLDWNESRYRYYVTLSRDLMEQSILLSPEQQKSFLLDNGEKTLSLVIIKQILLKKKLQLRFNLGNMHLLPTTSLSSICCFIPET